MKRFNYCLSILSISALFSLPTLTQAQALEELKLSKNLSEPVKNTSNVISNTVNNTVNHIEASSVAIDDKFVEDNLVINEADLWSRIRSGYAIPNLDNRLVTYQTTWYSSRVSYLQRIIQRGSRYLYHVVEALDKRGMPTDLALLPFIESAFNPQAISTAKASGMWQFMPATGRDFNLKQNIFKDDRRGVLDSTEAALDYLQRLYGMFGDWQLALAAYNWGEGSVQRAIKKQQALGLPIDFDSLSALMPNETKNYVPKLQAVKNIIGHPEQFNITLPQLDNTPYFISVKKEKDIDVSLAAKLAEIPLSEFKALNPQFSRPVITGGNTRILLPIENLSLFESNLQAWKGPFSSWTTLNVNKTERVELLANRFGYKAEVLREVNAIPAKMLVKAGSTILVPKSEHASDENIPKHIAELAQLTIEKAHTNTRKLQIKVGRKENLAAIAKRYKVSVADIKEWNKLHKDQLTSGQKLVLHVPGKQTQTRVLAKSSSKTKASTSKKLVHQNHSIKNGTKTVAVSPKRRVAA